MLETMAEAGDKWGFCFAWTVNWSLFSYLSRKLVECGTICIDDTEYYQFRDPATNIILTVTEQFYKRNATYWERKHLRFENEGN
jgi:hypothetical protein